MNLNMTSKNFVSLTVLLWFGSATVNSAETMSLGRAVDCAADAKYAADVIEYLRNSGLEVSFDQVEAAQAFRARAFENAARIAVENSLTEDDFSKQLASTNESKQQGFNTMVQSLGAEQAMRTVVDRALECRSEFTELGIAVF
ncbi:hypothetical protein [Tropicimonas sp. S265A]|uniref:hypothetical protein n=1 Tax=Tropicimonas sp. S265A TaxID=3415134 RepID=UPI003C7C30B4